MAVVTAAISDVDVTIRGRAVYTLAQIGGASARHTLSIALGDREAGVREAAAQVLAELEADC